MKNIKAKKKNRNDGMQLNDALSLALFCKFGMPTPFDEISVEVAEEELQKANWRHPTSVTIEMAYKVVREEYLRIKDRENAERGPVEVKEPSPPERPANWKWSKNQSSIDEGSYHPTT